MEALQFVFIGIACLVFAYIAMLFFSWSIRHTDWLAAGIDALLAPRRGYRLVRMVPEDEIEPDELLMPDFMREDESDELLPLQTDSRQTALQSGLSEIEEACKRARLDRSKESLVSLLVTLGWGVGDIRQVIKGDNNAIGALVAKAKAGQLEPPEDKPADELGQIVDMIEDPDRPSRLVPVRAGADGTRYTLDDLGQPRPLAKVGEDKESI